MERKKFISSLLIGFALFVFNTVALSETDNHSYEFPQTKETYQQMEIIQQNLNPFINSTDKVIIGTGWKADLTEDSYQNMKRDLSSQFGWGKVEVLGLPSFKGKSGQESFPKNAIQIADGLNEAIGGGKRIHYVPHSMQALDFSMLTILSEYKKNPKLVDNKDKKVFDSYLSAIKTELQKQSRSPNTFWRNFDETVLPNLKNVILYDPAIAPPVDKTVLGPTVHGLTPAEQDLVKYTPVIPTVLKHGNLVKEALDFHGIPSALLATGGLPVNAKVLKSWSKTSGIPYAPVPGIRETKVETHNQGMYPKGYSMKNGKVLGKEVMQDYSTPYVGNHTVTYLGSSGILSSLLKPGPISSYWTHKGPDQPRGKTMTEAQIMTEMVQGKKKVFIVGDGPEAKLMYTNVTNRLGEQNVKWFKQGLKPGQMQMEAKKFGADAILGVKEFRPLTAASSRTGSTPIDWPKIQNSDTHTPPDTPDKMNRAGASYKGANDRMRDALKHSHDMNKARNPGAYGWPGKWGRPDGPLSGNIGGVMLQGAASVSKADASGPLTGGSFSLIFTNARAEIDIGKLRRFVTALWAVYFSEKGPGISIDPIAPGVDKHLVRYIGNVVNSDLGRVMRETDYIMKKWAVGTERPDVEGFRSVDDLTARHGLRYLGASRRFWFVPEEMRFKKMENALLFESGRMTLKTEYIVLNKGTRSEPADEAFARTFTQKYNDIAVKYPIYGELFEYAKLVSLARYLKEQGIPLLWFLLVNKDMVMTEDSPGTVDALAKKSDYCEYITIEGGVDLAVRPKPGNYVFDRDTSAALMKAIRLYGTGSAKSAATLPTQNIIFESMKGDLTLTPSVDLTLSSGTAGGEKYQTDLALRLGKDPGLELVRYYDPGYQGPPTFGKGWHLMVPYDVRPQSRERVPFANVRIPKKMVVKNLLSGREEVLVFSDDRYTIAGYVPDTIEESNLIGLFLLTDGSFRLADKLGNEFQFHTNGHLAEMILAGNYRVKFQYGYEKAEPKDFDTPPFRIEPSGDEFETVKSIGIGLPARMKLVQRVDGDREEFRLAQDNPYGLVGYVPKNGQTSRYIFLSFMSDGSFQLEDKNGNHISFDRGGRFAGMEKQIIKGLSKGDTTVTFKYDFSDGTPRIRMASVSNKERSKSIYKVSYEYGKDHRLCRVVPSFGQPLMIDYDENRVVLARR